jgi:hypothetical protein
MFNHIDRILRNTSRTIKNHMLYGSRSLGRALKDCRVDEARTGIRKCLSTYQFTRLQREAVVMTHCDLNRSMRPHDHQNQVLLVLL